MQTQCLQSKPQDLNRKGFYLSWSLETTEPPLPPRQVPEIVSYILPRRLSPIVSHCDIPSGPGTRHGFHLPRLPVMLTHVQYVQGEPPFRETRDDREVTMSLSVWVIRFSDNTQTE